MLTFALIVIFVVFSCRCDPDEQDDNPAPESGTESTKISDTLRSR